MKHPNRSCPACQTDDGPIVRHLRVSHRDKGYVLHIDFCRVMAIPSWDVQARVAMARMLRAANHRSSRTAPGQRIPRQGGAWRTTRRRATSGGIGACWKPRLACDVWMASKFGTSWAELGAGVVVSGVVVCWQRKQFGFKRETASHRKRFRTRP